VHQVDPLQGEQVALGDHAAQALVLDQADVGDVPLGHGDGGVEGAVIRRQEKRRMGHVRSMASLKSPCHWPPPGAGRAG
jgi:hypothetical protein